MVLFLFGRGFFCFGFFFIVLTIPITRKWKEEKNGNLAKLLSQSRKQECICVDTKVRTQHSALWQETEEIWNISTNTLARAASSSTPFSLCLWAVSLFFTSCGKNPQHTEKTGMFTWLFWLSNHKSVNVYMNTTPATR